MNRIALLLILAAGSAGAADFRAVQDSAAVLYDGPSRAAKPMYVVSRDYPLEIISMSGAWVKVRDHAGELTWIERKSLGERRTLLVTANVAEARVRPEDGAPLAFGAAQGVVLELVQANPAGWLQVRHADGATGYVRAGAVWGN